MVGVYTKCIVVLKEVHIDWFVYICISIWVRESMELYDLKKTKYDAWLVNIMQLNKVHRVYMYYWVTYMLVRGFMEVYDLKNMTPCS